MNEPIKAITHYGDFTGTVSIDRADMGGDLLQRLAGKAHVPRGYVAVAFAVDAHADGWGPLQSWSITVYSIDEGILAGRKGQELDDFVGGQEQIPVFSHRAEIEPAELAELLIKGVKRIELVAATRRLAGKPMVLLRDS